MEQIEEIKTEKQERLDASSSHMDVMEEELMNHAEASMKNKASLEKACKIMRQMFWENWQSAAWSERCRRGHIGRFTVLEKGSCMMLTNHF
jgi:hypothetical protein